MALVLTRKSGQEVELSFRGEPLGTIAFQSSGSGKVKLAFDVHPDLHVLRGELAIADLLAEAETVISPTRETAA